MSRSDKIDKIWISGIDCPTAIGVTAGERSTLQRLSIDLEFLANGAAAARTDDINDAIDYAIVAKTVAEICSARSYCLVETLAECIAERVLREFPTPQVRVLIRKISPIDAPQVAYVAVEIVRP